MAQGMIGAPHADKLHADVLIVGAGIAGLLAAYQTLQQHPGASILLVEQGLPLHERRVQTASRLEGYGGAGLYLGGRLYLGPATIPVLPPVTPPPELRPILAGEAYATRAAQVNELLTALGIHAPVRPVPDESLAQSVRQAGTAGLEYLTSFPSRQPTLDERFAVLDALETRLRAEGVRFAFATHAGNVSRVDGMFAVELVPGSSQGDEPAGGAQHFTARALVLAPGRYGAQWLVRTAGELGARVVALPAAFGVRLEVAAAVYDPLTSVYPDPRLQLRLDGDAVIKTYATCPGGIVLPVERYGRHVASGVPRFGAQRGANTTLAILLQPGATGAQRVWHGGDDVAAALNARAPGTLLVQRLGDLRERRPTAAVELAANPIAPSCPTAVPGAFADAYPSAFWSALDGFLARLDKLAPGVDAAATLVYAPAEERFWHFPTDEHLQTNVPGLFVAGDATGQSQGVIQAGTAGMLAGEGVARFLGS